MPDFLPPRADVQSDGILHHGIVRVCKLLMGRISAVQVQRPRRKGGTLPLAQQGPGACENIVQLIKAVQMLGKGLPELHAVGVEHRHLKVIHLEGDIHF